MIYIIYTLLLPLQQLAPRDVYEKAFNISPETVYGFILLILLSGLILSVVAYRQELKRSRIDRESHYLKLEAMTEKVTTALNNSNTSNTQLKETMGEMVDAIHDLRETVISKL